MGDMGPMPGIRQSATEGERPRTGGKGASGDPIYRRRQWNNVHIPLNTSSRSCASKRLYHLVRRTLRTCQGLSDGESGGTSLVPWVMMSR